MTPLEKEIERKLVALVKRYGGRCDKVINQSMAGFPDRLLMFPGGLTIYLETKRPKGGRYSPLQNKWRDWLVAMGHHYYRIKDTEQLAAFELVMADEISRKKGE